MIHSRSLLRLIRNACFGALLGAQAPSTTAEPGVGAPLGVPSIQADLPSPGGGTVADCTEASLRLAMANGGPVRFACDGTITLSNTLDIALDTSLDANGHQVTLSGGQVVRLFQVNPGVRLTLRGLTLADGLARGTNAFAPESPGGEGLGGAVLNRGVLVAHDVAFLRNTAAGGTGGAGSEFGSRFGGAGGSGHGGAIGNLGSTVELRGCRFTDNRALGGTGGLPAWAAPISRGGDAAGGALWSAGDALLTITNCIFTGNSVAAGQGQDSDWWPGNGGNSRGGALALANSTLALSASLEFGSD
jgi:hypothetical protein